MNRCFLIAVVALCLGTPLLYVLSAGPVVYLETSGRPLLDDQAFEVFYYPLVLTEHHVPPFGELMHRYVEWWRCDSGKESPPEELQMGRLL